MVTLFYWLLVVGCWLLVMGCWLWVVGITDDVKKRDLHSDQTAIPHDNQLYDHQPNNRSGRQYRAK